MSRNNTTTGYATVLVDPDHLELLVETQSKCQKFKDDFKAHGEFSIRVEYTGWFGRKKYRLENDMAGAISMLKASDLEFFYYIRTSYWNNDDLAVLDSYYCLDHLTSLIDLCQASRGGMIQIDQHLASTYNYLFPEG